MTLQFKEKCLRCGKDTLITDIESGEIYCEYCGSVVNETTYDLRPERTFTNSITNKAHTGDKTTLARHDRGLSTMIAPIDKDSFGVPLSFPMKFSIKRLRRWDSISRCHKKDDRNLQRALTELLKMREKLFLSEAIIEKSAYIYRKVLEKKLTRGHSIAAMIGASLYAACRESETPRTIKEVANSIGIKRRELSSCYRLIFKELNLKMPVVDSISCLAKIASNADLSEKTKRVATTILKKAEQENVIAGKHPMGLAASALYIASMNVGEYTTQRIIASAAGITEVTVRNRCKGLKKVL